MSFRPALLLTCLLIASGAHAQDRADSTAPLPGDSVYHVQAQLTDAHGQRSQWRDLQGQPRLVSMFYTGCHVMCPLILENAKAVQRQLPAADRDRLGVVMVSLDPAHDTPAALADTARRHRLPAQWQLLQPGQNDARAIASVLDIRYRARDDGSINHTSVLVLLDAQGRILARGQVETAVPDPVFVDAVRKALAPSLTRH